MAFGGWGALVGHGGSLGQCRVFKGAWADSGTAFRPGGPTFTATAGELLSGRRPWDRLVPAESSSDHRWRLGARTWARFAAQVGCAELGRCCGPVVPLRSVQRREQAAEKVGWSWLRFRTINPGQGSGPGIPVNDHRSLITVADRRHWQVLVLRTPNLGRSALGFTSCEGEARLAPRSVASPPDCLPVPLSPQPMSSTIQAAQRQRCGSRRCRRSQRRVHSRGGGDELPQS